MAREVKETPVLSGKDAEIFARTIKANESRRVPSAEYERAKAVYERVHHCSHHHLNSK